jgi:hypothetical protein
LTGRRLHCELREARLRRRYTILTDLLREIRPTRCAVPVLFRDPARAPGPGGFAHFQTVFPDEPGVERIIWLFSLVLGHSRMLRGRFVLHQDLQTLLCCLAARGHDEVGRAKSREGAGGLTNRLPGGEHRHGEEGLSVNIGLRHSLRHRHAVRHDRPPSTGRLTPVI